MPKLATLGLAELLESRSRPQKNWPSIFIQIDLTLTADRIPAVTKLVKGYMYNIKSGNKATINDQGARARP